MSRASFTKGRGESHSSAWMGNGGQRGGLAPLARGRCLLFPETYGWLEARGGAYRPDRALAGKSRVGRGGCCVSFFRLFVLGFPFVCDRPLLSRAPTHI